MRRTKAEIETSKALEEDVKASVALQKTPEYQEKIAGELAVAVRKWRGVTPEKPRGNFPASRGAQMLGMSKRTFEGIEQGRGFTFPTLLILALKTFD